MAIPRTARRWEGLASDRDSSVQAFRVYRTTEGVAPLEKQMRFVATCDMHAQAWASLAERLPENNEISSEERRRERSGS